MSVTKNLCPQKFHLAVVKRTLLFLHENSANPRTPFAIR